MTQGTETSREICVQIGQNLPSRSVMDTDITKQEIQRTYATYSIVCPESGYFIEMIGK